MNNDGNGDTDCDDAECQSPNAAGADICFEATCVSPAVPKNTICGSFINLPLIVKYLFILKI